MDDKNTIQTTMSGLINDVRDIVESGLKKAYQNVNAISKDYSRSFSPF